MKNKPRKISLDQWDDRYKQLKADGLTEAFYGGGLSRHFNSGDRRLGNLMFDDSAAGLRLWNFLLSENERLKKHHQQGKKIIGVMKDLGTTSAIAYCFEDLVAFCPDGAWWIPCTMELSDGLLGIADKLGVDESFCPVRAMLGAFMTGEHFPIPDMLTCSVGAICDDFSTIAQKLESMGYPICWWEMPIRRQPQPGEKIIQQANGIPLVESQVDFVQRQLEKVAKEFEKFSAFELNDSLLTAGISAANKIRCKLRQLRDIVYSADICPLGSLEMMIAEMMSIHYCSDIWQVSEVLDDLISEVHHRIDTGVGVLPADAVRVFWINPVADLRMMNLLEDCGGRCTGTEFMFTHAIDDLDETLLPMRAFAAAALSDPMVGPSKQRAERISRQIENFSAEAVVISRIPGASHCAMESSIIAKHLRRNFTIPILEIEVPVLIDSMQTTLRTRLEALVESVLEHRKQNITI